MTARRAARVSAIALAIALLAPACKRAEKPKPDDAPPALVVKDDTPGLLLTWIDEHGDFHVEQKVSDVPLVGRDAVRVVDPTREEGTHSDRVLVADLRLAGADGTYPVHPMTRAEFDALAVARRAKEAAKAAPPSSSGEPSEATEPQAGAADPGRASAGRPAVIVYGASWCGACHDAIAYLKRRGITFVEKDVEQDPKAAEEMRSKLARAGLRAGSIPVLDVRGRVMVGFNPREVDAALGQPL